MSDFGIDYALAKDLLRRVLGHNAESRGSGLTSADFKWSLKIVQERPWWAVDILTEFGFKPERR